MTASESADCAHGARYSSCDSSVMYAPTVFSVGVGNVMVESGLQYCCITLDALVWSSLASRPQSEATLVETSARTLSRMALEEQMHDWSFVTSGSQSSPMVRRAML